MNLSQFSCGSRTPSETQTGLAELKRKIDEACELWPESKFYLQQLSCYAKLYTTSHHKEAQIAKAGASARVFRLGAPPPGTAGIRTTPRLSQVIVREGHLTPESVVELASQCPNLPLEFFLGHLELERVWNRSRTSYELPALPSRRGLIAHVRLPTLWRCNDSVNVAAAVYSENRVEADKLCIEYEKRLMEQGATGATRFRKVHMHNWKRFTVEQMASLCLVPDKDEEGAYIGWFSFYLFFFSGSNACVLPTTKAKILTLLGRYSCVCARQRQAVASRIGTVSAEGISAASCFGTDAAAHRQVQRDGKEVGTVARLQQRPRRLFHSPISPVSGYVLRRRGRD
jgi:hypothetical protein